MFRFDVITIFPEMFDSFLAASIVKRAVGSKVIAVRFHNPRDATADRHRTVDDKPYGGGPGMLMMAEPIVRTLERIRRSKRSKIVLLSPGGQPFTQARARTFSQLGQLILVCGRYEGVDERVKRFVDLELSIGPYVLAGGEVAGMAVIEAVTRLLPGAVGDSQSVVDETFGKSPEYVEYPQYTRPPAFRGMKVPKVLLSGDHAAIAAWRKRRSRKRPR